MKLIKAATLARNLGIPRRTVSDWCRRDRKLAKKIKNDYYIYIDRLAECHGLDPIKARLILNRRLIKARTMAELAHMPRRTLARWCRDRSDLAIRIGRVYYLDLEGLGCTEAQAEALRKWVPYAKSAAKFVHIAAVLSPEEGE